MKQSLLFSRTQRFAPKDEVSKNAQLLIRAGYIHKEMAGVYAYLPLGLRVLEKIKNIVREEMNAIGGSELIMTTLQNKSLWERTDRWDDKKVDVWFKSELKAGGDIGFGWSHEEPIGNMLRDHITSFRDLSVYVYQFQTKLRNELRAKSGIMRGREFVMKDLYSFARNEEEHNLFYNATIEAYNRIFKRLGIGNDTFVTFASGGAFTQFSHEFQTICEAGEDEIYINRKKNVAFNKEIFNQETLASFAVTTEELECVKTAEVGNIFNFGRTKAESIGLFYTEENGEKLPVWMGSYGIGITRVMGVLVEKRSDEKGLVWDRAIAPYHVHILDLEQSEESKVLYEYLVKNGIDVLWDDRPLRPGEKFAQSDLVGIPFRVVVSQKSLEHGGYEFKKRASDETMIISREELLHMLQ